MSNVIHVEFGKKNVECQQCVTVEPDLTAYFISTDQDSCLFEYLSQLRDQGIDDDDILDVADAINDYEVYQASDEVVQQLADGWLRNIV